MISTRFIMRLLCALALGCCIALYLLQHDERFKAYVQEESISLFSKLLGCNVQGRLAHIQFFGTEVVFEDILVNDPDQQWSWRCKQATCTFSVLRTLIYRAIPFDITLHHVQGFSVIKNGNPAIWNHIKKMIDEPIDVPVTLHALNIRKGTLFIDDKDNNIAITVPLDTQAATFSNRFKTTMQFNDVVITHEGIPLLLNGNGIITLEIPNLMQSDQMHMKLEGTAALPQLGSDKNICWLKGSWHNNQGKISCVNADQSLTIVQELLWQADGFEIQTTSRIPLPYIEQLCSNGNFSSLKGFGTIKVHVSCKDTATLISGSCDIDELHIGDTHLGKFNTSYQGTIAAMTGLLTIHNPLGTITGRWDYHHPDGKLHIDLANSSSLQADPLKYWSMLPQDFSAQVDAQIPHNATILLQAKATHELTKKTVTSSMQAKLKDTTVDVQGAIDQQKINMTIGLDPHVSIQKFEIVDPNTNQLARAHTEHDADATMIETIIQFPLIKKLLGLVTDQPITGHGEIHLNTTHQNNNTRGTVSLDQGNIRLLSTYNFIQNISGQFNLQNDLSSIDLTDVNLQLHRGSIALRHGTIMLDKQYQPEFMHIPTLFDNVLLTLHKDLFIVASGSVLLFQPKHEAPLLKGTILIERGQIKKNILAATMPKSLSDSFGTTSSGPMDDLRLDLLIESNNPVQVKTAFLEAQVKLNISIKGTVQNPLISGELELLHGKLAFPYKPLHITNANIYFLPGQHENPSIDMVARGKVKKYTITLRVNGTAQQPLITLESTPQLSEEKIITLLLAGSEEGSFTVAMPALIMYNLQQLIFGPEPTESTLERSFRSLISPFKSISIVPILNDQTGRGGLRGALEVEVNDRLSGKIQRNFSLTEDTKYEAEYLLSDDISVRGTKDERGDVGGELEMRWKF